MKSYTIQPYRTVDWVIGRKAAPEADNAAERIYGITWKPQFSTLPRANGGADGPALSARFEGSNTTIILDDFSIREQGLRISLQLEFKKIDALFAGENAVATSGDVLAAAIMWDSKDSLQKGSSKPAFLEHGKTGSFSLQHDFDAGQLRNSVNLSVALFLHKFSGGKRSSEFAGTRGSYLGTISGPWTLLLEGSASLFPVIIDDSLDRKSAPWSLRIDYDDPLEDSFAPEHFAILINKNHPDAKFILPPEEDPRTIQPALKEIVSAAMSVLIQDVRSNTRAWTAVLEGNAAPGSIGAAVAYMHDALGADSPEQHRLISQIRSKL
jgi:hypothetical protein